MSRPLPPGTLIDPSPARPRALPNNSGSRGSRLKARIVPKPLTLPLDIRLRKYIVAKYESDMRDRASLVGIVTRGTEDVTWRVAARMSPGKFAAKEESPVLKGRRNGNRRARAARTEHQVDSLLRDRSRA